ncbi:uncharacterized protein N7529_006806 [Penicillium soppii]|uniref:uncharacterized protein n=1 Tax=Penicillium soppii TaxID=69789 RepID=UPI0025498F98|nr:uncharacterized protein N7529_006806 [Penicillium soppii]KAJ5864890.1 hypothetical protein N7529_006806 [Penicillium soppii]
MAPPSHPKLAGLDLIQTTYKTVASHSIRTDILIPQNQHTGKRPIIIRFHGGGLVTADSLYMDFWPQWLTDLAIETNAIILSPNYRLLPSATSTQIYEDVEDFWAWVHSPALADLLAAHGAEADLARILSAGESAGGLLSIALALAHPEIRACTAAYPCVDLAAEAFNAPREVLPFGISQDKGLIEKTIEDVLKAGVVESSIEEHERLVFMLALVQHGALGGLYERGTGGEGEGGAISCC